VPVNNSAYVNWAAAQSLSFCVEATKTLNLALNSSLNVSVAAWSDIASRTYIPFDAANAFHPESDNYERGATVKQSDTILLYFPWAFNESSEAVQRNDLVYYGAVSDPKGPAMTWAMFVINWLALGEAETAMSFFDRSFANIQPPFDVWTETADGGGSVNFIKGAGGFLQQFLFGFPGMRITKNALTLNFEFLPWPEMAVVGVDLCANELDFLFVQSDLSYDVTVRRESGEMALDVVDANGQRYALALNETLHITAEMNPIGIVCIQ